MAKTVISPDLSLGAYFKAIFINRKVLSYLIGREVLSRYRQTTFGILWAALQPVSMMLTLSFIYTRYISADNGKTPYMLFVLAGLIPWQLFTQTIESASMSLLRHKSLITKIYIPRIFIPLSQGIVGFIDTGFGIVILLVVMWHFGIHPQWKFLLLPVFLFYSFYCALGLGLIFAVLNVQYRDVQYIVPFILRLGFFLTPISYPVSGIPAKWLPVFFLNPLSGAIELVRWSAWGGDIYATGVIMSLIVSTLLFIYSIQMFQKMEFKIVDVI